MDPKGSLCYWFDEVLSWNLPEIGYFESKTAHKTAKTNWNFSAAHFWLVKCQYPSVILTLDFLLIAGASQIATFVLISMGTSVKSGCFHLEWAQQPRNVNTRCCKRNLPEVEADWSHAKNAKIGKILNPSNSSRCAKVRRPPKKWMFSSRS